jgi:hypothetical protein
MIEVQTSDTRNIPPGSGCHVEEPITTVIEIPASYMNPPFTDPLFQPVSDPPYMRYIDSYSSYYLPLGSTTTQYFGVNSSSFHFPQ